ncbi:sensor histidine kinase [Streptomyces sp. NPDC001941]|uniref:sensor histidine kinase n=1 Tax=Streptomyces sp. NPDC001941 TaxID=3154659 RepID=UPI00332AFA07
MKPDAPARRTTPRIRALPTVLRAALWEDLATRSVPFPGGRRGSRTVVAGAWVLALVAFFAGTLDLIQHYALDPGVALALTVARAVPLVLALSRPRTAWWTELAAVALTAALTRPVSPAEPWPWAVTSVLTLTVTLGVVGLRAPRRAVAALWGEVLLVGAVFTAVLPSHGGWLALLAPSVILAVTAVTVNALRDRVDVRARLAVAEERGAAEEARASLLAERARIARELHDVVAHHMSVITVQADSAPYRVADVSPGAAEEFAAIAGEARTSLAEMRRLLHVLRSEDAPDGEHAPQPDLSGLPELIETTRRAGIAARLTLDPGLSDPSRGGELPAAVALSAYRLVQEALSNVVRHAPGAEADVEVTRSGGALRVSVVNSPARGARPAVETRGGGHGLLGMRERVAMLEGEFSAAPLPGGGFRMAAVLPLPQPSPPGTPSGTP